MKVKVTKTMARELNKHAKNKPYRFEYRTATTDFYRHAVNYDIYTAYDYGDYDYENGFKYIAVIYDGELYAVNQYITTFDLVRLFDKSDTVTTFCERVVNAYEI